MSKICFICGKKPSTGFKVSHAHNKTKRRWLPNLQSARILWEGVKKRVRVCTSCISAGKITKA